MPKCIRYFLLTLVTLSVACLATEWVCSRMLHLPYPYDWPLFAPEHSFNDLIIFHPRFAAFGTPQFFDPPWYPFTYPAPVALLYGALYSFRDYVTAFLIAAGALTAGAILLFAASLRATGFANSGVANSGVANAGAAKAGPGLTPWRTVALILIPTILCAYPLAFEFQQANLEIFVTLLTTLGICCFVRERPWPAAICFAFAASLKLFPVVFLVLFLSRRQYRQAGFAAALSVGTMLVSLWLVCPSPRAALAGSRAGATFFKHEYALRTTTAFDHSLFGLLKAATVLLHLDYLNQSFLAPTTLTAYLAAATALLLVICLRLRRLPVLNQVIALSVVTVLLPPVSFDYTLLNLYAPWGLLVLFALKTPPATVHRLSTLAPLLVSFAILFAPVSELIFRGVPLGAQLKSLTLASVLLLSLISPLGEHPEGSQRVQA